MILKESYFVKRTNTKTKNVTDRTRQYENNPKKITNWHFLYMIINLIYKNIIKYGGSFI